MFDGAYIDRDLTLREARKLAKVLNIRLPRMGYEVSLGNGLWLAASGHHQFGTFELSPHTKPYIGGVEGAMITTEQVRALMAEAAQAGDDAQVAICRRALDGSKRALAECRRVAASAQAQDDSVSQAAATLGRKGGQAGTGASKVRAHSTSEHMRAIRAKAPKPQTLPRSRHTALAALSSRGESRADRSDKRSNSEEQMRQSISTRYIGPTNTRGSRVKARSSSGLSITLSWDDTLDSPANHTSAARALAVKLSWCGTWVGGASPDDRGYVYVNDDGDDEGRFTITRQSGR
jgi:hypothetical protein